MNGANEAAVGTRFLQGTLIGRPISVLIERALEEYDGNAADSIESVIRADRRGRECVTGYVAERVP